ncbi:unnamed protein product [Ectocarpus sp. CCAP 1310/34]|nr:unnamed protein product [Ectocarpus sp. CCAP 1310/34]
MSLFFKGYWSPKTEEFVVTETDDLTAILVDSTDATPHGKCNAVYIGYAPSTAQVAALTAYSAQYKVRLVYFPSALTHTTDEFTAKLGIQTYFAGDIVTPAYVQLTTLGGEKVSITQPGFQTDPNVFSPPLFSYPVIINAVPEEGVVEVLAQLALNIWGTNEAAVAQRCTGQDLSNLLGVQQSLNTQYSGSEIITEFAFNGGGIAEHVSQSVEDISYVPNYEETMVTLKGTKWFEDGQPFLAKTFPSVELVHAGRSIQRPAYACFKRVSWVLA